MVELEKGKIYPIRSRNLSLGAFDGDRGFIGIRVKFGDRYLFTEYLADGGAYGTVSAYLPAIDRVPEGVPLEERGEILCSDCRKPARWLGPPAPANWECDSGCDDVIAFGTSNPKLLGVLEQAEVLLEDLESQEIKPEWILAPEPQRRKEKG